MCNDNTHSFDFNTKAIKGYVRPSLSNDSTITKIRYFNNPLEISAYDIQASIAKSLGLKSKEIYKATVMSRISRRMVSAIEKLEQKTGKAIDEDYLEKMMNAEMLKVQGNEIDPITIFNNVLNKLERM